MALLLMSFTSTVTPIPKNKGLNPIDSTNYRGITLNSVYGEVFDLIMMHKFSEHLCTSPLQFGFKAERSTSMLLVSVHDTVSFLQRVRIACNAERCTS